MPGILRRLLRGPRGRATHGIAGTRHSVCHASVTESPLVKSSVAAAAVVRNGHSSADQTTDVSNAAVGVAAFSASHQSVTTVARVGRSSPTRNYRRRISESTRARAAQRSTRVYRFRTHGSFTRLALRAISTVFLPRLASPPPLPCLRRVKSTYVVRHPSTVVTSRDANFSLCLERETFEDNVFCDGRLEIFRRTSSRAVGRI